MNLVLKATVPMEFDPQDAFEIKFYENLLKHNSRDLDALEILGGLYSKYRMNRQALRIDRRLSRLLPSDPRVHYNLACSLSLLGRKRDAFQTLERAIGLGYDDLSWMLQDPDLALIKGTPEFEGLVQSARTPS